MKITISPSEPAERYQGFEADAVPHAVTVIHPFDDLNAFDLMRLIADAVVAMGYAQASVSEAMLAIGEEWSQSRPRVDADDDDRPPLKCGCDCDG
jgi:hypothetical protein